MTLQRTPLNHRLRRTALPLAPRRLAAPTLLAALAALAAPPLLALPLPARQPLPGSSQINGSPAVSPAWLPQRAAAPDRESPQKSLSAEEAQRAAERWLDSLGPRGLVLTHNVAAGRGQEPRGFRVRWIRSPHWQGRHTTLALQEPGWWLQLEFRGVLGPSSDRAQASRLFDFLTLDRLPTPGLQLPGWEMRPLTPSSRVEQGVQILSLGNGRIRLRVRTLFFALQGHDPEVIRRLPADAAAPAGSHVQIRRSFPLDLLLDVPLLWPDGKEREGST